MSLVLRAVLREPATGCLEYLFQQPRLRAG